MNDKLIKIDNFSIEYKQFREWAWKKDHVQIKELKSNWMTMITPIRMYIPKEYSKTDNIYDQTSIPTDEDLETTLKDFINKN